MKKLLLIFVVTILILAFPQKATFQTEDNNLESIIGKYVMEAVVNNPELLIKIKAQKYGVDVNLAIKIASCESSLNPNARHKNITKDGKLHSTDIGLFQISDRYHKKEMASIGLNIYDTEDNVEYAMMLLRRGTFFWKASQNCWKSS